MQQDFLGTGIKFPPRVDSGTGRFAMSFGSQSVKESIYLILMTNRGERWLEPSFGSNLMNYTFMDVSVTTLSIMSDNIRSLILSQEPRVSDVDVEIDAQSREGCLIILINYMLAGTNAQGNMVFPFYLNAAREEQADETF
ncbi:MAG: GPW/gp25 family protein [Clostridiales bacterium]|nr:GPW/gp25 family protein [Clostridiales bacterium]